MIAMTRKRAAIVLVSAFDAEQAHIMGFEPYASAQEALSRTLVRYSRPVRMAIMPLGGSVLPLVQTEAAVVST